MQCYNSYFQNYLLKCHETNIIKHTFIETSSVASGKRFVRSVGNLQQNFNHSAFAYRLYIKNPYRHAFLIDLHNFNISCSPDLPLRVPWNISYTWPINAYNIQSACFIHRQISVFHIISNKIFCIF